MDLRSIADPASTEPFEAAQRRDQVERLLGRLTEPERRTALEFLAAKGDLPAAAEALGITVRTLRRRFKAMAARGLGCYGAVADPASRAEGE